MRGGDVLSALLALGYSEQGGGNAAVKQLPAGRCGVTDGIRQALKALGRKTVIETTS